MNKRIFREIGSNFGRYLALILMTVVAVGMGVGFLSGTNSAETVYVKYLEDNKLEDAYLTLDGVLDPDIRGDIEALDVKVYDDLYSDQALNATTTVRLLDERQDIDLPYVGEGKLPEDEHDIFLDQLFAAEQGLAVGDTITVGGRSYLVSGTGAFPDYTISIEDQSQMIADRSAFGVAMLSEAGFDQIQESEYSYNYGLVYEENDLTYQEKKDLLREIVKTAACVAPIQNYGNLGDAFERMSNAAGIEAYCGADDNQRISPVVSKMESNKATAMMFVSVVVVIIAFLYVIFIKHTMDQECSILGTLLAMGIRKKEILFSYVLPPCIVTLLGSVIGCILGKTVLYQLPISSLEGYYSIPVSQITIGSSVIAAAILAPVLLIFVINVIAILRKLSIKPLRLIRKDLSRRKGSSHSRFHAFSFEFRFRLRVFTQNFGAYLLLFIGIFLGGWLMIFGVGMSSSFDGYIAQQTNEAVSTYQYMVSDQAETDNESAEAATVGSFDYYYGALDQTYSLTGVGVQEDSRYFPELKDTSYGEVVVSAAASKKFDIQIGDTITLENAATGTADAYKVVDVTDYNMGLAVFMSQNEMNNTMRQFTGYHNYYFSDEELDLPEDDVVSTVTVDDMRESGQIMKDVMQAMILMFPAVSVIVYLLMMYLLIKMVIAKNEAGISMMKIFGFTNKEIRKMYSSTNTIMVVLLILISLPLQHMLMVSIWPACIATIPGFVDFIMNAKEYVIVAVTGLVCYLVSNALSMRKIQKIPMTIALKDQDA